MVIKPMLYIMRVQKEFAGESKHSLRKMLSFAFEGITYLSNEQIKMIAELGLGILFIIIIMIIYSIIQYFREVIVVGWRNLLDFIWAIGGLILFLIGIIGKYIGKVHLETKHRPRFVIETFLNDQEGEINNGKN